jgi:hypothetical protein
MVLWVSWLLLLRSYDHKLEAMLDLDAEGER